MSHKLRALRPLYDEHGATEYYRKFGATYRNLHEEVIDAILRNHAHLYSGDVAGSRVLDLACGSGEVTLSLRALGLENIHGIDPFTGAAYLERTGQQAEPITFEEIARGVLAKRRYDLCVCSFALHLAPPTLLATLCLQLALICRELWILTPHKRPILKPGWGFTLREEKLWNRVRLRIYESECYLPEEFEITSRR